MSKNPLSQKFTAASLLKFSLPTVIMMVFMSLYTMTDGVFVSRLVGTAALSALNIVYPVVNIIIAIGVMLARGGSAIVALNMGEGKAREAKENFTLIIIFGIISGLIITILGIVFLEEIIMLLGANEAVWQYSIDYGFTMLLFAVPCILQMLFQSFFVTAGKPVIGLTVIVLGGFSNIVLDYVFIGLLGLGIRGAAIATGTGFCIPGIFGLIFFLFSRKETLHFVNPKMRLNVLLKGCANGSSEMVTNLSAAVITFMFNIIMMKLLGEKGVAAITIVLYTEFLFTSIFIGYSSGVSPVISFKYGSRDNDGLQYAFKFSIIFICLSAVAMVTAGVLLRDIIVCIFAQKGSDVWEIAVHGFLLFSPAFFLESINIFSSSLFTALNNGWVSAVLSFLRTFLFCFLCLIILPEIMGADGAWIAVPVSEVLSLAVSLYFIFKKRKTYNYF